MLVCISSRRFVATTQQIWQPWAFSVAGPTVWNSLSDSLRDLAVESE